MNRDEAKKLLNQYFVGTKEVAEMLEWSQSQVSHYRRDQRLPAPIDELGGRPVWLKSDILKYKKERDAKKAKIAENQNRPRGATLDP